jgi:hypothetical protein
VTWNFRGQDPPRLPLSPSERRDSIRTEARLRTVGDSLVRTGVSREQVDRVVGNIRSGGGGGGFGGRGGGRGGGGDDTPPGTFVERPAEGAARGGGGGARGAAGGGGRAGGGGARGGGGQGAGEISDGELTQTILSAVSGGGRGGRGGRRGGGGLFPSRTAGNAALADPGDYTVTLTIGGQTLTQRLRVERAPTAPTR